VTLPQVDEAAPAPATHGRRVTAVAAAVLAISAVVVAVSIPVQRARSTTRTTVTTVVAPAAADGRRECIVGINSCTVASVPLSALAVTIVLFPDAAVVSSYDLSNRGGVRVRFLKVRTGADIVIAAQARCSVLGAKVADRQYGRLEGAGPTRALIVVGGTGGCSVAVTVDVPAGIEIPSAAATALAKAPQMMLTP
jgi:hypothetical protein